MDSPSLSPYARSRSLRVSVLDLISRRVRRRPRGVATVVASRVNVRIELLGKRMATQRKANSTRSSAAVVGSLIACIGVAVALWATGAAAGDSPSVRASQGAAPAPEVGPPACSLVAGPPFRASRPGTRTAQLWVQCNHRPDRLVFRSSKPLAAVVAEPTLYGATERDRLTCARRTRTLVICQGSVGADVRTRITVRLRERTCEPKQLRVRLETFGGLDCDPVGPPCPGLGLKAVTESPQAYGC